MGTKRAQCTLAIAFVPAFLASRAFAANPSEAELKAEFVERFTRFVDWEQLPETFAICVVGDSEITPHLEKIAKRQTIKSKQAKVVQPAAENVIDCQIVVIAGDDRTRLRTVISHTSGRPILSIAEAEGAAAAGAIINFYPDDNHIKFEINLGAATNSNLTVHSKLLRLARIVGKAAP